MAPDVDSEFTVYDDDGKTNEYQNGAYLKTKDQSDGRSQNLCRFHL